jgi:uncharacterized membrane protein YozB (DUF420 family)
MQINDLPAVNATLNALSAALLLLGFVLIKQGKREAHRACMLSALGTSALFLTCYLVYHFHHLTTRFTHPGWPKMVYYLILFTHIPLAVGVLPFILLAVWRALHGEYEKHKKLVRYVWPIWMYVSVTGVLVYLMLYQWFPPVGK